MALQVKQGAFQLQTTTGYQDVTGIGFKPRAVIFWWGGGNVDGTGTSERGMIGFAGDNLYRQANDQPGGSDDAPGAFVTINQGAHAWETRNNLNPTQAGAVYSAGNAITALNSDANTPTKRAVAQIFRYLPDGFRLSISNRDTNAMEVYYLALGGSDIEGADVRQFQAPASTGVQAYTDNGQYANDFTTPSTFTPTMLFLAGSGGNSQAPGASDDAAPMLGMATSTSERRVVAARNVDASATSAATHRIDNNQVVREIGQSIADLSTFASTGFSLNWSAIGARRNYFTALMIRGGKWKVGDHTTPTTAIDKSTTGVGFAPSALISAGPAQTTALNTQGTPYRFNMGGRGQTEEAGQSGAVQDGVASPAAARAQNKSSIIYHANQAGVLQHVAQLGSFDSDGFTLSYSTTQASACNLVYAAVGSNTVIGDGVTSGIATSEAFGVGAIATGFIASGIESEEAFGTGVIAGPVGSGPTGAFSGISSSEAFGVGTIMGGLQPVPPTPEPLWRMLYTDLDGNVIGEIEDASQRRFSFLLNHPRVITFKVDIANKMLPQMLTRKGGLIQLYRNRQLKMTAEILSFDLTRGQDNEKALAVSAMETMWVRLQTRLLGKSTAGAQTADIADGTYGKVAGFIEKGQLMRYFLDVLNAEDDTGIRIGSYTGLPTVAGGPWRYKPYLELLQELSATLNGFDFDQTPAAALGTGITGYLNMYAVKGSVKADAIFEYGTGKNNVTDYQWVVDGTNKINRGFALPADFPDNVGLNVASYSDATTIAADGLREAVVSQDLKDYDLRLQLATEHVAVRKLPMERFFFTPAPLSDLEPFVDYDVGDVIVGRVKDQGVLALNAQVRCYGITVEPSNEGTESVSLTLVDEP